MKTPANKEFTLLKLYFTFTLFSRTVLRAFKKLSKSRCGRPDCVSSSYRGRHGACLCSVFLPLVLSTWATYAWCTVVALREQDCVIHCVCACLPERLLVFSFQQTSRAHFLTFSVFFLSVDSFFFISGSFENDFRLHFLIWNILLFNRISWPMGGIVHSCPSEPHCDTTKNIFD